MSVPEFFSAALGTRIEPDGPIPTWVTESGLPESPWLLIGDDVVPNPAIWAQTVLAEDLKVMAVLGNAHGDLHLQNILLPMTPIQPEEFRLIDLSGYGADAPLARDPMHLLLSTLLPVLDEFSAGQKGELLTILARLPYEERAPSLGLQGRYLLARGVYDAGLSAMTGAGMRDDWADQTALALSATALMFATLPRLSRGGAGAGSSSRCARAGPVPGARRSDRCPRCRREIRSTRNSGR